MRDASNLKATRAETSMKAVRTRKCMHGTRRQQKRMEQSSKVYMQQLNHNE